MKWNFLIRFIFILAILAYLIFQYAPTIIALTTNIYYLIFVLLIFILIVFGVYKFLKAGLKK